MTHQFATPNVPGLADAGEEVAQLAEVLQLVERIAEQAAPGRYDGLDDFARLSAAYAASPPIVQRRFDTLAAETASWAATGVEALVALQNEGRPARAAAARLAEELRKALSELARILA